MTLKTDKYQIGLDSVTDTNNFLIDTDGLGALRIRRKSDGSGGLVMSINSAGIPLDKDGFDMRPLGVGQTLQNVAASRALGTTYTNSTGRTIFVEVNIFLQAGGGMTVVRGGSTVQQIGNNTAATTNYSFAFPVLPGQTYAVNASGTPSFTWWETL